MKNLKDIKKHSQFIPRNAEKYIGRYPIIVRSSWERKFFQWLDVNPSVLEWSSESFFIFYFDPVTQRRRRYFPDVYMLVRDNKGKTQQFVVEIKPRKETIPPVRRGRKTRKTLMYEERTHKTNIAKWNAAVKWCDKMGMVFKIFTERELFGEGK